MYRKLRAMVLIATMLLLGVPVTAYAQTNGEERASETESTESTEEVALETNTFSEDGNATLGNRAASADDKEFITVTTKAGNVFYLVIDHQRDSDNVYFLNMVDESDLSAFTTEGNKQGLESIVSLPAETESVTEKTADTATEKEEVPSKDVVSEGLAQAKSGSNLNYLIVIAVVGVFGIAYYFKIHKKKQQASFDEYETEEEYEAEPEYEQDDADVDEPEYEEDEYEDDEADEQAELAAQQEAKRQAKLEEERQAKLEQERIRKKQIREKQEQLDAQSRQLEEEQNRLKEEQERLAAEQEKIRSEQEHFEEDEEGVF